MVKDVHISQLIYPIVLSLRYLYQLASINLASGRGCMQGAENVQGFKYLKPIVALVPQTDYEKYRQIKDIFYLLKPLRARQRGKRTTEEGKDRD